METCGPFTYSKAFPLAIAAAIEIQESIVQLESVNTDLTSVLDFLRGKCAIDFFPPLTESEVYALLFQRDTIALGLFLLYIRKLDERGVASQMRIQLASCICKKFGVTDVDIANSIADQWLREIKMSVYLLPTELWSAFVTELWR